MTSEEAAQNFQDNKENTEQYKNTSNEDESCESDNKIALMLQNEEDRKCGQRKYSEVSLLDDYPDFDHFERHFDSCIPTGYKITRVDKIFLNVKRQLNDKNQNLVMEKFNLDEDTKHIIYQFMKLGILESVNKVVHVGKKSTILQGYCQKTYKEKPLPSECAIKIYTNGNQQRAEREMNNLIKLKNANIPCPEFVILKKHVIIMSFISDGDNKDKRGQKLKDTNNEKYKLTLYWTYFYIIIDLQTLFRKAELIPVNLSEDDILYKWGRCYFMGVRHMVAPSHKNAFDFLMKSCQNIVTFYQEKNGVFLKHDRPQSPEELFKYITGYYYDWKKELIQFQDNYKKKRYLELCKTLKKPKGIGT